MVSYWTITLKVKHYLLFGIKDKYQDKLSQWYGYSWKYTHLSSLTHSNKHCYLIKQTFDQGPSNHIPPHGILLRHGLFSFGFELEHLVSGNGVPSAAEQNTFRVTYPLPQLDEH
jgi:hypothetical protein